MIALLAIAAGVGTAPGLALAQGARLAPGDLVYNGSDQQLKVGVCRSLPFGGRECETVLWQDGRAASNPSWWNEKMLLDGDARVRRARGLAVRGGAAASSVPATSRQRAPATIATTAPRPVAGTRVPDGRYTCQIWMGNSYVSLGAVRSVGGRLSPDPVTRTGGTITGVAPSAEGIVVSYTTARGYRESMDCKRV